MNEQEEKSEKSEKSEANEQKQRPESEPDQVLASWGWGRQQQAAWPAVAQNWPGAYPARVVTCAHEIYRLRGAAGESGARPAGSLRRNGELPAVGDWVAVRAHDASSEGVIEAVLPCSGKLSRKVSGSRTEEQVVAANVNVVFLVMGLDGDFNLRRIERFVAMAHESGVEPVVVLTKADLLPEEDAAERRLDVQCSAPAVPVVVTSPLQGTGLEPLTFFLSEGNTVALVGSSGVGKSTLINRLMGEEILRTSAVRSSDDRGRHTTTHRELVRLPTHGGVGGGLLIDNPGIRELQLWSEEGAGLQATFAEIEELAAFCRFRDCGHEGEPGCAVQAALADGALDARRLENLRALEREQRFLALRRDDAARRRVERKQGAFYKAVQNAKKDRR
jgi:ribosome biogenesis GTPase